MTADPELIALFGGNRAVVYAEREFVPPQVFAGLEREGVALGFRFVAAGPLVRSSYKAGEYFVQRWVGNGR